jgi:nitrogen fixation/metabolism regulation signal transduction histidine kinase
MNRSAKIIVAVLVIAVIGFFIYSKLAGWHKKKVETAVTQVQQTWQNKTGQLEQKITSLQNELTEVKNQKVPTEKLAEVFGG